MTMTLEDRSNKTAPSSQTIPPAIIFGGNNNALSLVRSLGARSIPVYVLNKQRSDVSYSQYAQTIKLPADVDFSESSAAFLTSHASDYLRGSILLAASDDAIEVINQHRDALAKKFQLDLSNPAAQEMMLDKLTTYELARDANVPTPQFWQINSMDDVDRLRSTLLFPLIVKPKISHIFERQFNAKYLFAENFNQLEGALAKVAREDIEVLLVEYIPGPDSQLCSYYTYLDENGEALFDFTKRIVRRYPSNMGLACYHVTDHVPDVGKLSLRLFRQAGLRGLANAEFKMDPRDGQLKLIECNARFTAANGLVARAGMDLGSFVYNRLAGLPQEPLTEFRDGLRLWDPMRDLRAFRELRSRGELTFFGWIRSLMHWQTFPAFAWSDPLPSLVRFRKRLFKEAL